MRCDKNHVHDFVGQLFMLVLSFLFGLTNILYPHVSAVIKVNNMLFSPPSALPFDLFNTVLRYSAMSFLISYHGSKLECTK